MAALVEFLQANPLYALGSVFLVGFFIFSLIKKAVTLIIMAAVLNFAFSYYLHDIANDAYRQASETVETVKDLTKDLINQ